MVEKSIHRILFPVALLPSRWSQDSIARTLVSTEHQKGDGGKLIIRLCVGVDVPARPYAEKVFVGDEHQSEIMLIGDLKQKLENGTTLYGREYGRRGQIFAAA